MRVSRSILIALAVVLPAFSATAGPAEDLRVALNRGMTHFDLAETMVAIDRIIDPTIDAAAQLAEIDRLTAEVKAMLPPGADSWQKVDVLRRYIYQPGPWNRGQVFVYDLEGDPLGESIENKVLSYYLADRLGNCITMPFLFIIIGQRIGLDVWPALAPLHVLVKFRDDQGHWHNLETTSGAWPARDSWYNRLWPITKEALSNGVYLKPLNERETLAAMGAIVLEDLLEKGQYVEAIAAADLLIELHPRYAFAIVKKGAAYGRLIRDEFAKPYPNPKDIPQHLRPRFAFLSRENLAAFATAEALGWRE